MNCLVVDDDEMIRLDLEKKIRSKSFLRYVGSAPSAGIAAGIMAEEQVDLVFLDILMPGMTGLEFLASISFQRPQVIVVSSETKFAVDAFDFQVTDFLAKPVSEQRFMKAVLRALEIFNNESRPGPNSNHLFVKTNGGLVRITLSDILFIEAQADYVTIHTVNERFTVHSTMKTIQESLPAKLFFRSHNSFIINLDKITKIENNMVVIDKRLIPVSRAHVKPLLQRLNMIQ